MPVSKLQQNMRQQGKVGMRGYSIPVTAKISKLDTSMIEGQAEQSLLPQLWRCPARS